MRIDQNPLIPENTKGETPAAGLQQKILQDNPLIPLDDGGGDNTLIPENGQ